MSLLLAAYKREKRSGQLTQLRTFRCAVQTRSSFPRAREGSQRRIEEVSTPSSRPSPRSAPLGTLRPRSAFSLPPFQSASCLLCLRVTHHCRSEGLATTIAPAILSRSSRSEREWRERFASRLRGPSARRGHVWLSFSPPACSHCVLRSQSFDTAASPPCSRLFTRCLSTLSQGAPPPTLSRLLRIFPCA